MRIREYSTALPVVFHGLLVVYDASLCSFLVFFIFNFFRFFASAAFSSASPVVSGFILFTKHQTYFLFR